jgi:dihydrofolate reductase
MSIVGSKVSVEGHAIVSVDGMIAAADGTMPAGLRNDADWRLFQAALDRAALVVLGRIGHERHPNPGRRRLVLTRSVATFSHDAADPLATLWNPSGIAIAEVLEQLGIAEGVVAITGGTGTFDLFVPHYDRFILTEVRDLPLPEGLPCFSRGNPWLVLPGAGLEARDMEAIDRGVVQTQWVRP